MRDILRWLAEFAVLAVLAWLAISLVEKWLPRAALGQIAEMTNTKIDARQMDFNFDGSVNIRHLVVKPHKKQSYDNAIIKAEKVNARFGIWSLLLLRPRLKQIDVNDFVFNVVHDVDSNEWNLAALRLELPKRGRGVMPLVRLENGTIQYVKATQGRTRAAGSAPISARFTPAMEILGGYSFDIALAPEQDFERSRIVGNWVAGKVEIGGHIWSRDIPGFAKPWSAKTLDGELTFDKKNYALTLKIEDLIAPESSTQQIFAFDTRTMFERFAALAALQMFFTRYSPAGRMDVDLQLSGPLGRIIESGIRGSVHCRAVSVVDREFPYRVDGITGEVEFTKRSATLTDLVGQHGQTEIAINGWTADFGAKKRYNVKVESSNMALDEDLYTALGAGEKRFWRAFSPSGIATIDYFRTKQPGSEAVSDLKVVLIDVNGRYDRFPYPLEHVSGMLFFDREGMTFANVVSQAGERRITINGRVTQGPAQARYDITVEGRNVGLDSTLEQALPAAQRGLAEKLAMSGLIDANINIFTPSEANGATTYLAEIYPRGACLKSEEFPLEICGITGKAIVRPDVMEIEKLTGRYGGGDVALTGWLGLAASTNDLEYCLSVEGKATSLTGDLIGMLPRPAAALVSELRPAGDISFRADLNRTTQERCGPSRLVVECLGNTIDCNMLPYRLDNVTGRIIVTEEGIRFQDICTKTMHVVRGMTIPSTIRAAGMILVADREGVPEITQGQFSLNAENLRVKGKALSGLQTVVEYEPNSGQWRSKYLSGRFYDGKITGKIELSPAGQAQELLVQMGFDGVDLQKFLADKEGNDITQEGHTTGTVSGSLGIVAPLNSESGAVGQCRLTVSDMHVGRLSPLAKLLQVLKLTEPTDFAFDRMIVDSYLRGGRVEFRTFDLSGQSLAFSGTGWLDLRAQTMDLTLTARGRRLADADPSVLQSLTEGLGKAVLRINVKGNLADPQITTTTLPVIKETFSIFGTRRAKAGQ